MWFTDSVADRMAQGRFAAWRRGMRMLVAVALAGAMGLTALVMLRAGSTSAATTWAPGFYSQKVVDGLNKPTAIDWAPDGRMFIALREGKVLIFQNGQLLPTPFIDLTSEVNDTLNRGLLGLALHPDFNTNHYMYLLYTYDPPELPGGYGQAGGPDGDGHRVARLIRVQANGNVANLASKQVLLGTTSTFTNSGSYDVGWGFGELTACEVNGLPVENCIPSESPSHSIGSVVFGTDGSLFVSVGDGARFTDVDPRALRSYDLNSLAGKILRINPSTGAGYVNNPFYGQNGCNNVNRNCAKVYAIGLRNPFRMIVHPTTGEPYHSDVGWFSWEEINTGRGKNFGWPCWEGNEHQGLYNGPENSYEKNPLTAAQCQAVYSGTLGAVEPPYHTYPHYFDEQMHNRAVVVGPVYTGTGLTYPAAYHGQLFFADFIADWIKTITLDGGSPQVETLGEDVSDPVSPTAGPVQMKIGPDGDLYYVVLDLDSSSNGQIRRIRYIGDGNRPPTARLAALPTSGLTPLQVSFSAAASSDPEGQDLVYDWDLGDVVTVTTIPTLTHTYTVPGVYTTVLTVTDAFSEADSVSLSIVAGNRPPTVTITTPLSGTTHTEDSVVSFSGHGSDPEDGPLTGNNLLWEVTARSGDHLFAWFQTTGTQGSFIYPRRGGVEVYQVRVCLKGQDNGIPGSGGVGQLKAASCIWLYPNSRPTARITATPSSGLVPLAVTFSGAGSSDPEGQPLTYAWNFGDAITATGSVTVSHTYPQPGTYTATLTVRDTVSASSTASVRITATTSLPPVAVIHAVPSTGVAPLSITFSAAGSYDPEGTLLTYRWDFGNTITATGSITVTHRYTLPGVYTATLTVIDAGGTAAGAAQPITVRYGVRLPVVMR